MDQLSAGTPDQEMLAFPARQADPSAVAKVTSAVTRLIARLNGTPLFKLFVDDVYSAILAIVRDIPLTEIPQDIGFSQHELAGLDREDVQAMLAIANQRTTENRRLLQATVAMFQVFDIPIEASILRFQQLYEPKSFARLGTSIGAVRPYLNQTHSQLLASQEHQLLQSLLARIGIQVNRNPTAEIISSYFVLTLWMLLDALYRKRNARHALSIARQLQAWLEDTANIGDQGTQVAAGGMSPPTSHAAEREQRYPAATPADDTTLMFHPDPAGASGSATLILSMDYERQLFKFIRQYRLPRQLLDKTLVLRYINPRDDTPSHGHRPPIVLIYLRQSWPNSFTSITYSINQNDRLGHTRKLNTTLALLFIAQELILRSQFNHANTVIMIIEWYIRDRIVLPDIERRIDPLGAGH